MSASNTPTSSRSMLNRFVASPSTVEAMYNKAKEDLSNHKEEFKTLLRRLIRSDILDAVECLLLEEPPLLSLYECFDQVSLETSRNVQRVLIEETDTDNEPAPKVGNRRIRGQSRRGRGRGSTSARSVRARLDDPITISSTSDDI